MARFEYVARDQAGAETRDILGAETVEEAVDALHKKGYLVVSIKAVGDKPKRKIISDKPAFGARIPPAVLTMFTRQLTAMVRAGLPLIRALHSLAKDQANKRLSTLLRHIASDIEAGATFSGALARHPDVFSSMYIALIKSGEESGSLVRIMEHLTMYMERTEAIKRKVKAAMTYPALVVAFAGMATAVLFIKIVPMMASIYDKLGADLPTPTKVVVAASGLMRSYVWLIFLILVMLAVLFSVLKKFDMGRLFIDSRTLSIPIFGQIIRKAVVAKFARTLGVLVESGLPIMEAFNLARGAAGSEVYARAADRIARAISRGTSLAVAFNDAGVFSDMVVQMVSTGEESGTLGDMLAYVSDYYDEQVETSVGGLSSIIEPLMIIVIGAIIALVLVAMFLPVFYLGSAIRQGV